MRKHIGKTLGFIMFILSITAFIMLMVHLLPEAPVSEIDNARASLAEATRNKADTYSSKIYKEAKSSYDSAMANWQKENKKFIYFRNYEKVRFFAVEAASKAEKATESSVSNSTSLKKRISLKIDSLSEVVSELNRLFGAYPLQSEIRNRISKGKMLFEEAKISFEKSHFLEASRNITDAEYLLTSSYENAFNNLKSYFVLFPQWKRWIDKTVADSKRNGDYSIIIDKFSHKLFVYHKGVKKHEFEAELGRNWVGDKRVRGDNATPEGMYKITKKLDRGRTKYYKALLIDYPNSEDIQRFKTEVSKGILPSSARIGGLIEIHGNGGKGTDWTEGCVALTDKEMDLLFKLTKTGTPVTIIGSSRELSEILKK